MPQVLQALAIWASFPVCAPTWAAGVRDKKIPCKDRLVPLAAKLESLRAALSPLGLSAEDTFRRLLNDVAHERARAFLTGIRAYHAHPARRTLTDGPVVWQSGTTVVRDLGVTGAEQGTPILLIPSLVNRSTILDLDDGASFARFLAIKGFHPLIVDWGEPGPKERAFDLDDYVTRRLVPALDFVTTRTGRPAHVLGYCLGGLLALALALLRPQAAASLVLMATPWDVPPESAFADLTVQLEPYLEAAGVLPVDVLQSLFTRFQPTHVMTKFARFGTLDPASPEARRFVLTEDWLNDGVPLTAPVTRTCFRDFYGRNFAARGHWRVGGRVVDPHELTVPAYAVVPGKDRIVTPESALPLARALPHATLHEPMMGHIGLLTSLEAPHAVWTPLATWLQTQAVFPPTTSYGTRNPNHTAS